MRKFLFALLYVFVGLVSVGVWSLAVSLVSPLLAWTVGSDDIDKVLSVWVVLAAAVCFVAHAVVVTFNKLKKRNVAAVARNYVYVLIHAVPLAVGFVAFNVLDMRYGAGGWGGYEHRGNKDYYICFNYSTYDMLAYNKFGKQIGRTCSRISSDDDYIYFYEGDSFNGDVYDISSGQFVISNSNLYEEGEIFEQNGKYGVRLTDGLDVIVRAVYDELEFTPQGWLMAAKDGRCGMLTVLGEKGVDFSYDRLHCMAVSGVNENVIVASDDDGDKVLRFDNSCMIDFCFTTKHRVVEACPKNEFIVCRDGREAYPYAVYDGKTGKNLYGKWYYMLRYDISDGCYYATSPVTHEEFVPSAD